MRKLALFLLCLAAGLPALLPASLPALAQETYPNRTVTLVTPYPPGGGSDFLTRILAEGLKTRLNQTVVVQNISGAGGAVGSMQAAKAKPDGYTLLVNHIGMSTIPLLYKKFEFDPLQAYEFIGLFAEAPMIMLAGKDFAPKTFAELVAYAREKKERLTMASSGMGSATHLCGMLFQEALGVQLTMVQYKGAGPALIDVRSGQVDLICDLPTTTSGMIRSGDLKAYVLTAPRRMTSLPDVPTAAGMPSLDIGVWYGFYAPKGTPRPIIEILNKALREVVQDPSVAAQVEKVETYLLPLDAATPEAHRKKLVSQIELWRPIIEKAGIQAE